MEYIKQKAKEKLKKIFTKLYSISATIVTICWIIISLHLTLIFKFQDCISCCDVENTFNLILWITIGIMIIVYLSIISYFIYNKKKIGVEKINSIEATKRQSAYASSKASIIILPFYLLLVFSLSKLIVVFYQYYHKGIGEDIAIKIIILLAIFLGSLWAWCSFRETSTKIWSFWATVFAIGYILINIYWEYFLPYLKSYLSTINCIFKTIIAI